MLIAFLKTFSTRKVGICATRNLMGLFWPLGSGTSRGRAGASGGDRVRKLSVV